MTTGKRRRLLTSAFTHRIKYFLLDIPCFNQRNFTVQTYFPARTGPGPFVRGANHQNDFFSNIKFGQIIMPPCQHYESIPQLVPGNYIAKSFHEIFFINLKHYINLTGFTHFRRYSNRLYSVKQRLMSE